MTLIKTTSVLALFASCSLAFPHIARQLNYPVRGVSGGESLGPSCERSALAERNVERRGAEPLSDEFPYNGARNGLPSQNKGEHGRSGTLR